MTQYSSTETLVYIKEEKSLQINDDSCMATDNMFTMNYDFYYFLIFLHTETRLIYKRGQRFSKHMVSTSRQTDHMTFQQAILNTHHMTYHGGYLPISLQIFHNLALMCWLHAGKQTGVPHCICLLIRGKVIKLASCKISRINSLLANFIIQICPLYFKRKNTKRQIVKLAAWKVHRLNQRQTVIYSYRQVSTITYIKTHLSKLC